MEYKNLIEKCIKGNAVAQRELFEMFSGKMYYLCLRYAVDKDEAQDMLQEGFIRLFSNLESFKGTGSFEGCVRRIFAHTAIKYYHKMRKHNGHVDIEYISSNAEKAIALDNLGTQEILGLVQNLPDGYRVVFNMFAIEGFSHKEIAEALGIKESTSRSQLVKARKLLQTQVVDLQKVCI